MAALLSAFISGCAGEALTAEEWRFFQDVRPSGLILFRRNCRTPEQVGALVNAFKDAVGSDNVLVLVDQEGGRVQRLAPPHWRKLPAAACYGTLYDEDPDRAKRAAQIASQLVALDLRTLGINANCAPVLDVPVEGADQAIGDRAYSSDLEAVIALGRAVANGLLQGGVLPVMKHLPGHGRASVDSHRALPIIEAPLATLRAVDFVPFRALADLPIAMSAHVMLTEVDRYGPATTSAKVIDTIIRGEIGFDGLLLSDDMSMAALGGSPAERAEAILAAGCDIALHCNGRLDEMREVAASAGMLEGRAEERFEAALARRAPAAPFDASEALAALELAHSVEPRQTKA